MKSENTNSFSQLSPVLKAMDLLLIKASDSFHTLTQAFRQQFVGVYDFLDYVSCGIDPLLSLQRDFAQVVSIIEETNQAKTFVLRPSLRWKGFLAGQHIQIETEINGRRYRRFYSLSSTPSFYKHHGLIAITIKQIAGGRVSNHLHRTLGVGDILTIHKAAGRFICEQQDSEQLYSKFSREEPVPVTVKSRGLLFIAAGSGITPFKSMLETLYLEEPEQKVTLIFYANRVEELIFRTRLNQLSEEWHNFKLITHCGEQISLDSLRSDCPDIVRRVVYLCGPAGFMDITRKHVLELNIAPESIRQENFGSASLPSEVVDATGVNLMQIEADVLFAKAHKQIKTSGGKTLLELAEESGLHPKFGCRQGICHECTCQRKTGDVLNTLTGKLVPNEQERIQACISIPVNNLTVSDW